MATQPITIGANSIANIGGRFFLIVEVEAKTTGVEIDPVFGVRTTAQQAQRLFKAGVRHTKFLLNRVPRPSRRTKVELKAFCSQTIEFLKYSMLRTQPAIFLSL